MEGLVAEITAIFWDVGGVLLNNAWDRTEREKAIAKFELDATEFQERHEPLVSSFEKGKLSLSEYLEQTVFYRPRPFIRDAFREYMFSLSQPKLDVLSIAHALASGGRYFMGTINNESLELNLYRIEKFNLLDLFDLFVSSCFIGMRKPEPEIYNLALALTQRKPEECCFIDDRPTNLECPSRLGMHVVQMQSAEQLRKEFKSMGVKIA